MKPYRTPLWSVTGTRSDKILQREPTPSESAIKRAALSRLSSLFPQLVGQMAAPL